MILQKIINVLEESFPRKNAEDWDNVGLLVGNRKQDIKKIQISLDATIDVIDRAIKENVDLIITHHPIIFKSIKRIESGDILGQKLLKLIENNIAVYSMHTNLDASFNGLNDFVTKKLTSNQTKIIDVMDEDEKVGIGRFYTLDEKVKLKEYINLIKTTFDLNFVRVITTDMNKEIKRIAIVNGSGMSYWRKVKTLKADLLITGDVTYHDAMDAKESNLNIVDMGHFESEVCFTEIIEEKLKDLGIPMAIYNDGPVFISY